MSRATLDSIMNRLDALEAQADDEDEDDGWVDVSGEKWKNKVGGRIMGDYVNFANQNGVNQVLFGNLQDYFEFRRMRIFLEGEGYGVYFYKLQVDFEPEGDFDGTTSIKDMYVGISEVPWLGDVYIGHRKEPLSLEELTSSKYITFMERALPNIFAPGRNVGITALNHSAGEGVAWGIGAYFNDISDTRMERVSDRQGLNLTGRVVTTPYFCEGGRHLVHLGIGGTWADDRNNAVRWRARPEVHEGARFIDTGTLDADDYYTVNLEGAMVWGRLSLQSELFYNRTNRLFGAPDSDFYGAYAYASWFLTGENRAYKRTSGTFARVKPFTNFWLVRGCDGVDSGSGAWELAARWSYLDLGDNTFDLESGTMNNFTLGVNWYWNPYTRMMLNYIHSWNDYSAIFGTPVGEADILAMRFQVDF